MMAKRKKPQSIMKLNVGSMSRQAADKYGSEMAAFKARNVKIAQEAIHGGRSYSELAREYHISGERISQIIEKIDPVAYLKKQKAWRNRGKIAKYGVCTKCGAAKRKPLGRQRRNYGNVNSKDRYCSACTREIYGRMVTLRCRCGHKSTLKAGRLLNLQKRGQYTSVRLAPDGKTGTHVCQSCWRAGLGRPVTPKITLKCRCGRKSIMSLRALLGSKARGGYTSARPAKNGKTGTYVCLPCFRAGQGIGTVPIK